MTKYFMIPFIVGPNYLIGLKHQLA